MNEKRNPCGNNPTSYETGNTTPPKSRVLFVFFLVLLIFLGGVVTALGLLNISLWNAFSLKKEEAIPLQFTRREEQPSVVSSFGAADPQKSASLGVHTETVSPFICAYYNTPQGVCIPQVPEGSPAYEAGLRPGDLLLSLDDKATPDNESLGKLLKNYTAGDPVTLTLFRNGRKVSVKLTLVSAPKGE
ncbi:MAG: PDZ domain-containing protein [Oscillospiraceae bacterium]|nr:PDZ domain-containing protein [Oscillospiraceae bacterium]